MNIVSKSNFSLSSDTSCANQFFSFFNRREGGREEGRGKEGGREGRGKEGGREERREGGREGGREQENLLWGGVCVCLL